MRYKKVKQQIKKITKQHYYNNFIKADEYQLPLSTITINKGTANEEKYADVESIIIFKRGFLMLHSTKNPDAESRNIDLIDIETFEIETQKKEEVK